jgi:cytoskeletal protein RodZ
MKNSECVSHREERRLGLTEVRKSRGISLGDIVGSTKISRRFLEAIEEERFDHLPGGVYDVNYIRQYAIAIGYDESALLEEYRRRMGKDAPPEDRAGLAPLRAVVDWFLAPAATNR